MARLTFSDGTYWSVRKRADTYWVLRLQPGGRYPIVETYGGYRTAGAAAGAVNDLSYIAGRRDSLGAAQDALEELEAQLSSPPIPAADAPDAEDLDPEEGD